MLTIPKFNVLAGGKNAKVPGKAVNRNPVQEILLRLGSGVRFQVMQSIGEISIRLLLRLVPQKFCVVSLLAVMLGSFDTEQPVLRDVEPIFIVLVVSPVTEPNRDRPQNDDGEYGNNGRDAPIGKVPEDEEPEDERNEAHQ